MKNRQEISRTREITTTGVFIVTMGLLLCWTGAMVAAPAPDTKKQTVTPSSTQKASTSNPSPKSSKVDHLLQQLDQARSLEQYNHLLKSSKLTPSEQGDLEKELAKPRYAGKLQTLLRSAKTAADADARRKAKQKEQEIAREQQQSLSHLNQQANEHHQRQIAKAPAAARAKIPGASTHIVGPAVKAPISLEGLPHITSVSSPITPGRDNLGIVGENFREPGEEMGTVSLTIGDFTADLPIISYSSVAIQARVPPHVCDVARREIPSTLEGGVIEGRVGVHTPRGTSVGVVQLNIPIDESQLVPRIGIVYPREVQPGQRVSIIGEKFLSREPGSVRFHFGSRTIDARVVDWAPVGILIELPSDVSGLRRTSGTVEVVNWVGRSDTASATFVPVEVTEELIETLDHDCERRESWRETRVLFDFDLVNGWRVVDRYLLDYSAGLGSCGAVERPVFGSGDPRFEVVGSCSRGGEIFGGDTCYCIARVTIQGPRGMAYRR